MVKQKGTQAKEAGSGSNRVTIPRRTRTASLNKAFFSERGGTAFHMSQFAGSQLTQERLKAFRLRGGAD
jgi:hypothetical protein